MPGVMKTTRFLLADFVDLVRSPASLWVNWNGRCSRRPGDSVKLASATSTVLFDERIAYTTLMTTLDRLFKKNLLERRKDGRAFVYSRWFRRLISIEELKKTSLTDSSDTVLMVWNQCSRASSTQSAREIASYSMSSIV
jgi:predicted transcriptional regulator